MGLVLNNLQSNPIKPIQSKLQSNQNYNPIQSTKTTINQTTIQSNQNYNPTKTTIQSNQNYNPIKTTIQSNQPIQSKLYTNFYHCSLTSIKAFVVNWCK